MTDRTEAEQFMSELLENVEEARIALARALDKHNVDMRIGLIALSTLHHQVHQDLDENDEDFVQKVTEVCIESVDEAAQRPRFDGAIH
jgi:hypothetical protein